MKTNCGPTSEGYWPRKTLLAVGGDIERRNALTKQRKKIPIANWERFLPYLTQYGTLKKHFNLLRAYGNYLLGVKEIGNQPAFLKVETTRACSLKCPPCTLPKEKQFYPFDDYRQLIDRYKSFIYSVSLYDVGEPLLVRNISDYITYAHERKIGTLISTSLSIRKKNSFWDELAQSGLDRLVVSIDGISPTVYETYRVGGNLDLVLANLQKVIHCKKVHQSRMVIEWQMIDFEWNRHEQTDAKKLAYELGCNVFRLIPEAFERRFTYKAQNRRRNKNCLLPYILLFVNAYNKVMPCYKIVEGNPPIGDLNHQTLDEIWNGEEVFKIRSRRQICHRTPCNTCQE